MHVIATAGHVDHGKSTLVRALTGMEPDRWAEERRRGMTIDLGFAWTGLPSGETVAFVDVPGHERFVPNMLAGIGPVPAAMLVVAADGGWMPQSEEHLAALDALGVRHGLLCVTRADLAPPGQVLAAARERIARSTLGDVPAVAVSAVTGDGLPELRRALDDLVTSLPAPDDTAPVRLWVDRVFTVRGAGTVVTGTLGAGRLRVGDELELDGRPVRVRGLQSLGETAERIGPVARVAVNLRGTDRDAAGRGTVLLTPGAYAATDELDLRLDGVPAADLPPTVTVHVGSAAVVARVRPLGADTLRLRLARPLPLRLGDRMLLRDPGRAGPRILGGATILDVAPPALGRRGAGAARGAVLATMTGVPDEHDELRRRGLIRRGDLLRMGVPVTVTPVSGDWLADPAHWSALRARLVDAATTYAKEHPLEPGAPAEALRHRLGLPDIALVEALVTPPLSYRDGRVVTATASAVPPALARMVAAVRDDLRDTPFAAPEAARLADLGLGRREAAAAVRAGLLLRVADGVFLLPGAPEEAARRLATLGHPFTVSEARQTLGCSRRVAVPLLELLDRTGLTRRLPDNTRELT
ncbi:selenocysteine-specific translation elongation factor [Catenuloplanes atrovinosus]|uniref:Selenocysteine-specific elongation factor n=1 Tax=Catenuloplanes atrovinosus TaxID=137266 RepID=A0AAE4C7V0_9ACTN|nr:selenocysteine-specific translation elongation factor [Catenuloplanes atrovinosus]MDR7273957.1 selenocysteine-specific elongation factor [Catenuloplanes atrovinosus]